MTPDPRPICEVHSVGLITYPAARQIQEDLATDIAGGRRPASLLLLEHPPTYTLGRRARPEDLIWGDSERAEHGVETYWIDRGGEATFHGPGQLVGYPILSLGRPVDGGPGLQSDYPGYLRRLEQVLITAVLDFGLAAGQLVGHTGVWVQPDIASRCPRCPPAARKSPAKLASIGVRVDSRGVTRHGFALNVDPEMSYWEGIVACGEPDRPSVSMAQLLDPVPEAGEVRRSVARAFGRVFQYEMVWVDGALPVSGASEAEPRGGSA